MRGRAADSKRRPAGRTALRQRGHQLAGFGLPAVSDSTQQYRLGLRTALPQRHVDDRYHGHHHTQSAAVDRFLFHDGVFDRIAALFNPSIVRHQNQRNLPEGAVRFIMSLRATGEGHVSSIVFRTGVIDTDRQGRDGPPQPVRQSDPCLHRHTI